MKKVILLLSIFIAIAVSDQKAVTNNGIEIVLKDDSTWHTADPVSGAVSPFALTADSQLIYLRDDGTWTIMSQTESIDTSGLDTLPQKIQFDEGLGLQVLGNTTKHLGR